MANEIKDLELRAKTAKDVGSRLLDGGGLVGTVRLDRSGRVVVGFEFRFRSPTTGKVRNISCGIWPGSTLREIRSDRDKYRLMVSEGADPIEARKAEKLGVRADQEEAILKEKDRLEAVAVADARMTVRDLFGRWEKTDLVERKDKGAEVRRMFEKDVFPHIGAVAVDTVRKGHIMEIVDNLKQRGVPRMTRVIFSLIRQMMRFAVDRDLIDADPSASIRKAKAVGKDAERDRVFSEAEIKQLASKLPDAGLSESVNAAVWIMLSTLCRVGELSKSRWPDLDLEGRQWRIPADVAKNEKEHWIALSDFAVGQFLKLKVRPASKVWIYPSRDGEKHLDEKTITKQLRDRQRTVQLKGRAKPSGVLLLSGGQWTSHDLRRTGATLMGELGVPGDTIERCLNHKEQNKLKRIYQRQGNEQGMADAWRLLGDRLELLTRHDAGNVVVLARA